MGIGSTVTKMYCQGSNNRELKEGSLSGWLRASPAPKESFWADVTEYPLITSHGGIPEMSYLEPFLDWPPWGKMRQFNTENCTYYGFYLLAYLIPPNNPPRYQTQAVGALLHLESWTMQPAAGSCKGYAASAGFSCGFPGWVGGGIMWISLSITVQALFILCLAIFSSYDCCHLSWGFLRLLQ